MRPWSRDYAGRFEEHELESDALRGNRLGDPHVRPLWIYTPPAYALEQQRRFASIYLIQGLTGQLDMWRNRSAFRPSVIELVDDMFADGACAPAVVVFVDAWTSVGGSQFVDSPGTGKYHTYLCGEVVPFVDARYRTLADAAHRGIAGKSSGGYGAMITPMLRPEVWERWLELDPVRMVDRHADALRGLRAIYVDAGKRDQFYLDLGAEAFRRALAQIGVTDVFFELFDATHSAIEYRYPLALRYLAERLQ